MKDAHSELALELYGEITKETRAKAKIINYQRVYSSGEIKVGKVSGSYPTK